MSATESQIYSGYEVVDIGMLRETASEKAIISGDHFIDGFGVKTLLKCVPFIQSSNLSLPRLTLPVPDDGFHAEAIEYVAVIDALRRYGGDRFCIIELGAGWGPWLGLAGVLARKAGVTSISLVGAEAAEQRYPLMVDHLVANELRPANVTAEDAQVDGVHSRLFKGAVWTHDGFVYFPESSAVDMGAVATETEVSVDYRGLAVKHAATPCRTLKTLLEGLDPVDFIHMDIQGSEFDVLENEIEYISAHVRSMLIATHSRVIEGRLIELLYKNNWTIKREKPCRVNWASEQPLTAKTSVDGSQYWINKEELAG